MRATANHQFLTHDGWMPLSELAPLTRMASLRHVPPPLEAQRRDDDEVVLLAHLLGAGHLSRRGAPQYVSTEEANLAAVTAAAGRRFGISAVREQHQAPPGTVLHLAAPRRLLSRRSTPLGAWLDAQGLGAREGHDKHVPGWVSSLPKEQVGLFLRHLWAAHGSVAWDQAHGEARLCYPSSSRRLVDDVARLLLRFNVFTRITRARSRGAGDGGWQVVVHGAENQLRFLDEIGVHGARAGLADGVARLLRASVGSVDLDPVADDVWDRVRDVLVERAEHAPRQLAPAAGPASDRCDRPRLGRETMARVADVLGDSELDVVATNDVYWDTITSIEPLGEQPVYDATVLGTHNFVADGIAAHNSLEQDADMVILLHRDDVYEKESTRPGEADLIVAKHRNGPTRDIVVAFQGHYSRFVDMAH